MGYLNNIIWSINKRLQRKKKFRIWAKYGDETRFHFDDERISIGEKTYGIPQVIWYDNTLRLSIGKYCSIADGVEIIMGGNHHHEWLTTYPFYRDNKIYLEATGKQDKACRNTTIGNDVWIGKNALILGGINIGDGAVIGAGSVVCKDIPPYAIAAGNPIKILKYRFSAEVINELIEIKWWDWDENKIKESIPFLLDENIEKLKTRL